MSRSSKLFALLIVVILAGAFLGCTAPGHQLLRQMNMMAACGGTDNC